MKNNLFKNIMLGSKLIILLSNVTNQLLIISLSFSLSFGQVSETDLVAKSYFQQKVDYNISATLHSQDTSLYVTGYFDYTNNSNDQLDYLYMHLWANAFNDKKSAYAQQKFETGMYDFHFCKDQDLGGYKDLAFKRDEEVLLLEPYTEDGHAHSDIAKMTLREPLLSGSTLRIHFQYVLDIPRAFDRLGYDGSLYRMTQWYPKPAVYDEDGWHPMPYLMMGEYYAEYGDYEVEINRPEDMALSCTGVQLSTGPSAEWPAYKSTTIKANRVLDFAWFASSDYNLKSKRITIKGGKIKGQDIGDREIDLHLLTNYEEGQDKVLSFMEAATRFYSSEVGLYPYPQYSLTLSKDEARGGMEYPMVSMVDHSRIGQNMDNLIAHEIGHNWFQSILGTNERQYPWLDEGLNSFYERAYNKRRYETSNNDLFPGFIKSKVREISAMQGGVFHLYCCGRLGAIDQASCDVDVITYVTNSYERTAWSLQYLESYLGKDLFKKGIESYYKAWQFKHPQPSDFRSVMEATSGKDLTWFFEGIIKNNKAFDYKFKSVKKKDGFYLLQLENKGSLDIPVCINAYDKKGGQWGIAEEGNSGEPKGELLVNSLWVEPASQADVIKLPMPLFDKGYSQISINGTVPFLDSDRSNNHYYPRKLRPKRPQLSTHFGPRIGDSQTNTISWMPAINFNTYDGTSLGLLLFSDFYPYKKTRWFVQPVFGLRSKSIVGAFGIERDFMLGGSSLLRKLTTGISGKRYHISDARSLGTTSRSDRLSYNRLAFKLGFDFESDMRTENHLTYKVMRLDVGFFDFVAEAIVSNPSLIHQLNYYKASSTRLGRKRLLVQAEYESYETIFSNQNEYLKLSLDFNKTIHYAAKHKFYFRFYGGYFLLNSEREKASFSNVISKGSIALTQQGFTDHTFDGSYFGRSESTGIYSQQVSIEEGGFKLPLGSRYRTIGMSNDMAAAINLKIDLPIDYHSLNLRPFLDVAVMNTKSVTNDPLSMKFYYSGGVAFEIGEVFSLYIPLVNSSEFHIPLGEKNILEKLSFRFNLKKWNPWKVAHHPGSLLYL